MTGRNPRLQYIEDLKTECLGENNFNDVYTEYLKGPEEFTEYWNDIILNIIESPEGMSDDIKIRFSQKAKRDVENECQKHFEELHDDMGTSINVIVKTNLSNVDAINKDITFEQAVIESSIDEVMNDYSTTSPIPMNIQTAPTTPLKHNSKDSITEMHFSSEPVTPNRYEKRECLHINKRGHRSGQKCGRNIKTGDYCSSHKKMYMMSNASSPSMSTVSETPKIFKKNTPNEWHGGILDPLYRAYEGVMSHGDNEYIDLADVITSNIGYIINAGKPFYVIKSDDGTWRRVSTRDFEGSIRSSFSLDLGDQKTIKKPMIDMIREYRTQYTEAGYYYGKCPRGYFDLSNHPFLQIRGTGISIGDERTVFDINEDLGYNGEVHLDDFGNMIIENDMVEHLKDLMQPVLSHIKMCLADGNESNYMYIMAWLANMIKDPTEKPGITLSLRGDQGAGKGTVFEWLHRVVLGNMTSMITNNAENIGMGSQFNESLEGKVLVVLDDLNWKNGLITNADAFKSLVTGTTININGKGRPLFTTSNNLRFVIITNTQSTVKVEGKNDRRGAAFECSNTNARNRSYFDLLYEYLYGPKSFKADESKYYRERLATIFVTLMTCWKELDDVNLNNIPDTQWRRDMMDMSSVKHEDFLIDIATNEYRTTPIMKYDIETPYSTLDIFEFFKDWCKSRNVSHKLVLKTFSTLIGRSLGEQSKSIRVGGAVVRGWKLSRKIIGDVMEIDVPEEDINDDYLPEI